MKLSYFNCTSISFSSFLRTFWYYSICKSVYTCTRAIARHGYEYGHRRLRLFSIMHSVTVTCKKHVMNELNPYLTNGFSHHYQLDESTFVFRGVRSDFLSFNQFFDENSLSKQNSPRWDAAFCGVTSGAIMFAYDARLK